MYSESSGLPLNTPLQEHERQSQIGSECNLQSVTSEPTIHYEHLTFVHIDVKVVKLGTVDDVIEHFCSHYSIESPPLHLKTLGLLWLLVGSPVAICPYRNSWTNGDTLTDNYMHCFNSLLTRSTAIIAVTLLLC